MPDLYELTACRAAEVIRRKELGEFELLDSCLSLIEDLEPEINAWKFLAPDIARARARELNDVEPVERQSHERRVLLGSCAAVAADMVPVSFGSRSASSTKRLASYYGLVGKRIPIDQSRHAASLQPHPFI
ncbi:hypothetical protein PQR75_39995 [Paraburkholderia fungorum]|jgi:Asp-tRNA(Asn)/Glu-tRNA(Gln) amidotransferase A subunit family amidase|uniref:hypothetical protein n=1 Tax=Paraburkholderia fungorum TaxID=134537 RepID=UPI0038BCC803